MSVLKQALWASLAATALAGCADFEEPGCDDFGCDDEDVAIETAEVEDDDDDIPELTAVSAWEEAARLEAEDGIARAVVGMASGPTIVPYADRDGIAVVGGDVELGPVAELDDARERGVTYRDVWFPTGSIPFEIENGFIGNRRTGLLQAINFLNRHSPLRIFQSTSGRRLTFRPTNATSYGGMTYQYTDENDSRPLIRLSQVANTSTSGTRTTTLHEMGHALGFPHEFQRPDRDSFVDICTNVDIWNYAKVGSIYHLDRHSVLSPFDYKSIMNSGYSKCVTGVGDTIERAVYKSNITPLSAHDINSMYRVYARALGTPDDGDDFAHAMVAADFDDDGYEDLAVASTERSGSGARLYVYFYRGISLDSTEGNAGRKHIPWFRKSLGSASAGARLSLAVGDFNGDDITDLAVGDPSYRSGHGRVAVITVNTPSRFGNDAPWGADTAQTTRWIAPADVGISSALSMNFGAALTAGAMTSSSRDDLVIGAPLLPRPGRYKSLGAVIHLRYADPGKAAVTYTPTYGKTGFGSVLTTMPSFCQVGSSALFDTFVVGAPGRAAARGAAHVYGCVRDLYGTQILPSLLLTTRQNQSGARYGFSLAAFSIQKNKSRAHYLVAGAPYRVSNGDRVGSVFLERVYANGAQSRVVRYTPGTRFGDDEFGYSVAVHQRAATTHTSDGVRIAIGIPGAENSKGVRSGRAYLWRPWVNGQVSYSAVIIEPMRASSGMGYGRAVAKVSNFRDYGGYAFGSPDGKGITWGNVNGVRLPVLRDSGLLEVRRNKAAAMNWSSAKQVFDQGTRGDRAPLN